MISNRLCLALCLALLLSLPAAFAVAAPDAVKDAPKESVKDSSKPVVPDALSRSAVDNYKDMLLARCIAQAYQAEPRAFADARASAGAMADWINVDPKDSSAVMDQLMNGYLSRNYQSPDAQYKAPYKDVRFDLLKCFDMYHSKELSEQAKRFVDKSGRAGAP